MNEDDEEMDENIFDDIFNDIPVVTHTPRESVATETNIPGTDFVFCVLSVSYANGKVKVKTSLEKRGQRRCDGKTSKKDLVVLKDRYTLDVSHLISGKHQIEPVDLHLLEEE